MKTKLKQLLVVSMVIMSIGLGSCAAKIDYYSDSDPMPKNPYEDIADKTHPESVKPTGPFLSIDEPKERNNTYSGNQEITVEYVGIIDANSIEVYVFADGTLQAVRLSEESKVLLEQKNLQAGDIVKAIYRYSDNDLVVIESIEDIESELSVLKGVYLGQIDSNSIEIKNPETGIIGAYHLSNKIKNSFDDLELSLGDKITIRWMENDKETKIITDINIEDSKKRINVIYKGQIDVNSIEVFILENNELQALRLADILKQNFSEYGLEENQTITIEYEIDENSNYVITQILD